MNNYGTVQGSRGAIGAGDASICSVMDGVYVDSTQLADEVSMASCADDCSYGCVQYRYTAFSEHF